MIESELVMLAVYNEYNGSCAESSFRNAGSQSGGYWSGSLGIVNVVPMKLSSS